MLGLRAGELGQPMQQVLPLAILPLCPGHDIEIAVITGVIAYAGHIDPVAANNLVDKMSRS